MASQQMSCTYCNCSFSAPSEPSSRIQCPRCDETITRPLAQATQAGGNLSPSGTSFPDLDQPIATKPALSNRQIGLLIFGVMVIMASIGLVFAWRTVGVRRGFAAALPKTQALSVPVFVRVALGVYVLVLVAAILRGWNRRERVPGSQPESWLGRFATPALALFVLLGVGLAL